MSKNPEERLDQAGVRKKLEEEATTMLEHLNISVGSTKLPVMRPVAGLEAVPIRTNVFKMFQNKQVPFIHYTVRCTLHYQQRDGTHSSLEITAPKRSDVQYVRFRHWARFLFTLAQQSQPTLIPQVGRLFYDGINDLFSLDPLNSGAQDLQVTLKGEFCRLHIAEPQDDLKDVIFDFMRTGRTTVLGDVLRAATPDIVENQNLRPLIHDELMLRCGLGVLKRPEAFGFPARNPGELHVGGYIAPGCKKTVRAMGSEEDVQFGVVIDPKVAPFHHVAQTFSEKVLDKFPGAANADQALVKQIDEFLKQLWFLPLHRPQNTRPLLLHHIAATNAETTTFVRGEQEIKVAAYFRERYGRELSHPHLPLVVVKQDGKDVHFPMELCEASTRVPADLERDVMSNLRALGMTNSDAFSQSHIEIAEQPLQVSGHHFEAPAVQYADCKSVLDFVKGSLGPGKYFRPASIGRWGIYNLRRASNRGGNDMTMQDLRTFHDAFLLSCQRKGVQIGRANDARDIVVSDDMDKEHKEIKTLMENAAAGGCQFVLYVTGKADISIHKTLKFFEQQTGIITQNVTAPIARQCAGIGERAMRQTFENVVNKTNMKNGGINYEVSMEDARKDLSEHDLFIGVLANVSGGGFEGHAKHPTVVGYAANDLKHSVEYSGDYIYQEPLRDEKVKVIMKIVETALDRFTKNRGAPPKRVFLYRNSSSEGSFDFVMRYEIPLVRKVLKETGAQLVFVVATRLHNICFTPAQPPADPNAKNSERNLRAGTCVDTTITHPCIPEFFLLGHVGELGTAKVPRYNVLHNEPKVDMEDLQRITFHLCFGHQIVNKPTSLPTPVFVASEMAKRGRNVYNVAVSRLDSSMGSSDFQQLTASLDYAARPSIRNVRFNS
ncbi:hypothetical protein M3Y99_00888000 [Aphelenchoides fujianensis]|nr:hypothetical protein M3Y99_00888000 [Aphelenchoides fujianensis]